MAIPTITAAVDARQLSALKDQRRTAAKVLAGPSAKVQTGDKAAFVNDVRNALYCSKICSYAQGYAMLAAADQQFEYGLNMVEIARIWKAGCIIRAVFLDEIMKAFTEEPMLPNLLVANASAKRSAQDRKAGGGSSRPPSPTASLRPPSAPRSRITTATAASACRRTSFRRSATSSAPTPMSGSTRQGCFTPSGAAIRRSELVSGPKRAAARGIS